MARLPRIQLDDSMEEFLSLARRHVFKPGSTIIFAGEESDSIFYITRGTVTVSIEDDTGREIIVAYLSEGQFVGEMAMFGEGTRTAWIKAKTECEVAELSNQRFTELSERKPGVMYALASQLADRLKNTTQKVGDLAFLDVTGRIAGALLELCDEPDAMTHPDGMQIKITRQELGRLVGCSREMAGRVLKALEYQGLVSVKGTTIVVFGTR